MTAGTGRGARAKQVHASKRLSSTLTIARLHSAPARACAAAWACRDADAQSPSICLVVGNSIDAALVVPALLCRTAVLQQEPCGWHITIPCNEEMP